MKSDKNFNKASTVNQLSAGDTVPADAVSRDPQAAPIHALVFDKDRFGNVLKALFLGDEEFAYATRRDDCYEYDGTRPNWKVREAGRMIPRHVPEWWDGADDDDILTWAFDSGLYHIDDVEFFGGELIVSLHDLDYGDEGEVSFAFMYDDVDTKGDDEPEVMTDGGVDEADVSTLEEIDDLREDGWKIKWTGRTGRQYPPSNRLVQLLNDDGELREFYISEEHWDVLDSQRRAEASRDEWFHGERA